MVKILFLDIDGVLHSTGSDSTHFTKLPLLESFLREPATQDVLVVISSTWREAYSLNSLRNFFAADIGPRIIDCTQPLDEYDSEYERGEEIETWIAEHATGSNWVALDDSIEGFTPRLRHSVVFTVGTIGLTDSTIAELRTLLSQ